MREGAAFECGARGVTRTAGSRVVSGGSGVAAGAGAAGRGMLERPGRAGIVAGGALAGAMLRRTVVARSAVDAVGGMLELEVARNVAALAGGSEVPGGGHVARRAVGACGVAERPRAIRCVTVGARGRYVPGLVPGLVA